MTSAESMRAVVYAQKAQCGGAGRRVWMLTPSLHDFVLAFIALLRKPLIYPDSVIIFFLLFI